VTFLQLSAARPFLIIFFCFIGSEKDVNQKYVQLHKPKKKKQNQEELLVVEAIERLWPCQNVK
jgi:hypothetical protein